MATRYAVANGNWSNVATWDGGASLPDVGDDVYADGKTVTIDQNITVLSIRTTKRTGGTVGGTFTITSVFIITANLVSTQYYVLSCNHTSGEIIITGSIPSGRGIVNNNTGDIRLTGDVVAGSANLDYGILNALSGKISIIGMVRGGTGTNQNNGIYNTTNGTINITGNIYGGLSGANTTGVFLLAACLCTINGNCYASTSYALQANSTSIVTINGDVYSSIIKAAIYAPASELTLKGNIYGYNNIFPILVYSFYSDDSMPSLITLQNIIGNDRTFYTAGLPLGNPATTDVRDGTTYGAASELTGTLIVPPPASVAKNVPTDNTVGTMEMTPQDFWTYATRTLTSGGGGITAADVWDYLTTGTVVSDSILEWILDKLDAKISSITSLTASDVVTILQNYDSAKQIPTNNKITDSEKNIISEIKKVGTTTTVEKKRPYTW